MQLTGNQNQLHNLKVHLIYAQLIWCYVAQNNYAYHYVIIAPNLGSIITYNNVLIGKGLIISTPHFFLEKYLGHFPAFLNTTY